MPVEALVEASTVLVQIAVQLHRRVQAPTGPLEELIRPTLRHPSVRNRGLVIPVERFAVERHFRIEVMGVAPALTLFHDPRAEREPAVAGMPRPLVEPDLTVEDRLVIVDLCPVLHRLLPYSAINIQVHGGGAVG